MSSQTGNDTRENSVRPKVKQEFGASGQKRNEINDVEEESEEAIRARRLKIMEKPNNEEVEEHMLTHLPFRSWCPHCVKGKARGSVHRNVSNKKDNELPTISMDYMFFVKETENEEANGLPTLVIRDDKSKMCWARVVKKKGIEEYTVRTVNKFLGMLGYTRIIMKSDNEPSVLSLKDEIKRTSGVEIVPEESPAYESKSNGEIEREIQNVQEQFRAMRDALETKVKERIPKGHKMIPWMVAHASDTLSRYKIGDDGRTPHERWKGKKFKRAIPEFGEVIHYLRAGTRGKEKDQVRWNEGCFLGVRNESG